MIYPCVDCKERHINCHGSCEKYLKKKQEVDAVNEAKNKQKSTEIDYAEYLSFKKSRFKKMRSQ